MGKVIWGYALSLNLLGNGSHDVGDDLPGERGRGCGVVYLGWRGIMRRDTRALLCIWDGGGSCAGTVVFMGAFVCHDLPKQNTFPQFQQITDFLRGWYSVKLQG